MSCIRVPK